MLLTDQLTNDSRAYLVPV